MTARLLDGIKIRDDIFGELRSEIARLAAEGIRPGLAAVLVGENPASQLYVKSKIAACEQLGLASWLHTPPSSVTTDEMLRLVRDLNADDAVDGILVQLPLPPLVDTKRVLEAVDPSKDVDGFHPVNLGRLVSGRPGLVACTPAGCLEILRRNNIPIEGANAVVLGRSDIVGKPMALLLMHANATVTICHSKTRNLPETVRRAEIIVAAMGKAGFVEAGWIRPGAAVIDVGTNKITDAALAARLFRHFPERLEKFEAKGSILVGDVHPDAIHVAGALTPVPGGVGPMTITMLMSNTVKAAQLRRGQKKIGMVPSTAYHAVGSSMLRLGLTGGIATGKTAVAAMLREMGFPVLEADAVAHKLMEPGQPAYEQVVREFGPSILDAQQHVDRAKLASLVFADRAKLDRLNAIVHPLVAEIIERQFEQWAKDGVRDAGFVEAALIVEAGLHQKLDGLVVTYSPPKQQLERLRERGMSEEEARRRIAAQLPTAEKLRYATETIDCSGSLEETRRQVEMLASKLRRHS